jgi:hypothetical protein
MASGLCLGEEPGGRASGTVTVLPKFTVEETQSVKTHILFMGVDIDLKLDADLYRVRDVIGSSWVVEVKGRRREIPATGAPLALKVTPTLKLTQVSATVSAFVRTKAYSFASDPEVALTRGLSRSASMSADLGSIASDAQARADTASNHALGGASVFAGSDDQFSANALLTDAAFAYSNTHPTVLDSGGLPLPSPYAPSTNSSTAGNTVLPDMSMDPARNMFNNPTNALNAGLVQTAAAAAGNQTNMGKQPDTRVASNGLDALDVDFDVRSETALRNPYVVTIARFRAPNTPPGGSQNLIYARSLDPIDSRPGHVHLTEEGFPFGYELLDFHLHLFNSGSEVATNVASSRVELTREEAFQYELIEYVDAHRHATLRASPVMGGLPADLPARLASGEYRQTFYARVSKEGRAGEAFLDPACESRIVDAYLESLLEHLRFNPALADGKPVEGTAALSLKDLRF